MNRLRVADYFFVPELPVAVYAMPAQGAMAVHRHEFAELTIITSGSASHVTSQGRYPIAAGDVFFIPPEQPHGFAETKGLGLSNVLFLPMRLSGPAKEVIRMPGWQALFESEPKYRDAQGFVGHLRLPPEELERVTTLVRELAEEAKRYTAGATALVESLFTQRWCGWRAVMVRTHHRRASTTEIISPASSVRAWAARRGSGGRSRSTFRCALRWSRGWDRQAHGVMRRLSYFDRYGLSVRD
jgi:hypothetical protein